MNSENETLVKDIQKSFLNLLNNFLPKNLLGKPNLKILSICCGRFREAKSIFDYFSDSKSYIRLYGIDNNEKLVSLAKEEPILKEKKDQIFLKLADATKIESYKEWLGDGQFDLLILRHPEITFNTKVFLDIFNLCDKFLSKEGYLLITTHFENEKEAIKLALKLLKFNVITEVENNNAPGIQVKGEKRFVDRFLLIARNV